MLIAQITDLHVTARGTLALGRIDTNGHLAVAVEHLERLAPRPDLVLATGDLVNDGEAAEYEALVELLAPLTLPLLVLPGNHDDRALLRQAFRALAYRPPDGEFLHRVVDDLPVRIVALDTQVPGRPEGALCPRRLGWLAERLAEAPERPTLIAMHHPPFATGIGHMDAMKCLDGEALADVLRRAPGVELIVCGHVHRPVTVRWAGIVASIAPSTAHQVALDLVEGAPACWTREPPAIALHAWAPETGFVSHLSYVGSFPATAFP